MSDDPIIHDSINAVALTEITEPNRDGRRFRVTLEHVISGEVTASGSINVTIPPYAPWARGDDVIPQILATVEAASDSLPNDGRKLTCLMAIEDHHFSAPTKRATGLSD